jgi:hypothetical protein
VRGGVRAIQLTDRASDRSVVIGTVKASAPGELLPPNQIVFKDAFNGIAADLILVWKHNQFEHDVLLRERPVLPEGLDATSTRLEVVTEVIASAEPELKRDIEKNGIADSGLIRFGNLMMVPGKAFYSASDNGLQVSGTPDQIGTSVNKEWVQSPDGRHFLVESVVWEEIRPELEKLALAKGARDKAVAEARTWPREKKATERKALQVAANDYRPEGYLIDYTLVSVSSVPTTYSTGETYIFPSYFYVSSATFEPGCVLKFYGANLASLGISGGSVSFADTQQSPVFTSTDDDSYGEKVPLILNASGYPLVPASDGDPSDNMAKSMFKMLYFTSSTEIRSAIFRWAQTAVEYEQNSGVTASHTIRNCLFENITGLGNQAIYVNLPSGAGLTLIDSQKCSVDTDIYVYQGTVTGSLSSAPFCNAKSFFGLSNNSRTDSTIRSRIFNLPPDTMGAVGPDHFAELVNKNIAVFAKSDGSLVGSVSASMFFTGAEGTELVDPRIIYDHQWQRWIACMLNAPGKTLKIATSAGTNPWPLTSANWSTFSVDVAVEGTVPDYPTLGVDGNGIYIVVHSLPSPDDGPVWLRQLIPIKKPSTGNITSSDIKPIIYFNIVAGYKLSIVQLAVNFDTVTSSSLAWFVAKGDPGSTQGPIEYGRLQWTFSGGNWSASFLEDPWTKNVQVPLAYYDLDRDLGFALPQKPTTGGTDTPSQIDGSRLQMAVIRNGYLWTCHHIGLDGGDDTYNGGVVDRTGIEWLRLRIKADNTLSLGATDGGLFDRIRDTSSSSPYFYVYPSLVVNSSGDFVAGFSLARGSEYIGAGYWGRKADGTTSSRGMLVQAGRRYFNQHKWGDYSYTSLDPVDSSFWTIQEYSESNDTPVLWYIGLWISNLKVIP